MVEGYTDVIAVHQAGIPAVATCGTAFGEGHLETALRAQVASLGLGDHVQFAGFREDLDRWMGCFDLFVHPATSEGLGVATLKAALSTALIVVTWSSPSATAVSSCWSSLVIKA